jgi:hypothetical protein
VIAHFVVGIREIHLFFAALRFVLLVAAALILLGFASGLAVQFGLAKGIASLLPGRNAAIWPSLAAVVINLTAAIVVLVIAIRAGFFLMTVAAREPVASLRRAGALARHNNLRLLVILLAILGPVVVATAIALPFSLPALASADFGQALDIANAHAGEVAAILVSAFVVALALLAGSSTAAYEAVAHRAAQQEEVVEPVRRQPYRPAPVSHDVPDDPGLVTAAVGAVPEFASEEMIVAREEPALAPQPDPLTEHAEQSAQQTLSTQAEAGEAIPADQTPRSGDAVHPLATLMPVDAIVLDNIGNGAAQSEHSGDLRDVAHEGGEDLPPLTDISPQPEQHSPPAQ